MLTPVAVLLLAVRTAVPLPSATAEEAVLSVAEAFRTDDVTVLHALAPKEIADAEGWAQADDVVEAMDCISIAEARIERMERMGEESATGHLRIAGWGWSSGRLKRWQQVPPRWVVKVVRVDGGWAVQAPLQFEAVVARELVAADEREWRAILDRTRDVDRGRLLALIADLGSGIAGERGAAILELALAEARATGDRTAEMSVLRMRSFHRLETRPEQALADAHESLGIATAAGDADSECAALFTLAIATWYAGDIEAARTLLQRSANMVDRIADPRRALRGRAMETYLARGSGRVSEGLAVALTLQREAAQYGWLEGEIGGAIAVTDGAAALGRPDSDLDARAFALALRLRKANLIGQTAANTAGVLANAGQYPAAIELYHRARALEGVEDETKAALHVGLAETHALAGDHQTAYAVALAASRYEHKNQHVHYQILRALGDAAIRVGRFEEALRVAARADGVGESGGAPNPAGFAATVTVKAKALEGLGRCEEAVDAYRAAIAMIESDRDVANVRDTGRVAFLSQRSEPYRRLAAMLLDERRWDEALRVAEMLKGRTLRDALEGEPAPTADPVLAARERELEGEVVRLNLLSIGAAAADARDRRDLATALGEAREQLELLRTISTPATAAVRSDTDPLARPRVLLPSESDAILDYSVGEEATTLFTITRAGDALRIEAHRIAVTRGELDAAVTALGRMLESRDLGYASAARALHRRLIEPARRTLAGRHAVAIIPDGPLWRLPFAVLRDARGRHLAEETSLFYAPSLGWLDAASSRSAPAARGALVVGDPLVSAKQAALVRAFSGELGPLPDAARESRFVASLYEGSRVLIGAEATEEAVKRVAPQYGVLHFATHALTETQQPLYSSIVLAQQAASDRGTDDGLLEAREILDLKLDAELVVLSACSTGRGKVHEGEGLVGLPWAFFVAGTTRTVVAQWQIDSAATAGVMMELHRNLKRRGGPAAVAESLRQAQLATMREPATAHPYYWAAFAVVGNGWPRSVSTEAARSR